MSKKQLIMETALELFAKQGFEATSVQQITDHCGISKGAFYLSFKSKDELILALIDHFMMQITADIDYIVRNAKNEDLLFQFYYSIYQSFYKHSDFAKVLMKEQSHTFNEELILKMQHYDKLISEAILSMIERLYGNAVKETKYDLMYGIKGFMNTYSQLFVFYNVPLDLKRLAESLVEKTNLLARHTTVPFVTEDLVEMIKFNQPGDLTTAKEQILPLIESKMEEMKDSIEKESLMLLKGELLEPMFPPAVVKGLIENIRRHPHCKWVSYLLIRYFELHKKS
ncbi:TetR/AcrR family transcriptional regulator [Neobacillus kokaensis]|uniref:TetR family transcriptional regulator n=1 Tax=Neobacillus kokaensis TaxID=2759023 RepID=A0ABQ3N8N7_9BACI|nr:TetR/AcrR family transcriptional regulator [Neobacillus kokaensis]GHI00424.1 TetR family transcriptional regulator [Neobacillus kokaensis]